ncbi:putative ATPase of the PP-loop superfamily implicated in cell cycle control [Spirochaeta africana DSM 8902]|uniref:Putative ATPase of the PP-loop superfamily implicated in cell cycle control n=2 Tax=Spirochaeta TaxID=146 RepID=H9UG03_SPIAZ|nr:putative ATPase of the PP-loop superfamily implicated in cell cycle control [Spirochaeta africana DSM 8902]
MSQTQLIWILSGMQGFNAPMTQSVQRFVKQVGKAINTHGLIKAGDRVLMGISGGKDSLSMAYALASRRKWLPVQYDLQAVMVQWREHPIPDQELEQLDRFFAEIEVPFRRIPMTMRPPSFKGEFNCYLCARNRKRVLFELAREEGWNKIAFGHHMDDIVETTLMNMVVQGRYATMKVDQEFFDGLLRVIRPLCSVRESMVARAAGSLGLPVMGIDCPLKEVNLRKDIKRIVGELSEVHRYARENIIRSLSNIDLEYLPAQS